MRNTHLHRVAQLCLFITSYLPLFLILIVKEIYNNIDYLHWGGLNHNAFMLFRDKFFFSTILILVSLFGLVGCIWLFKNMRKNINNGEIVTIQKIDNKNNESLNYIITYIFPFLAIPTNNICDWSIWLIIMLVLFRVYVSSNMLLVNPILSFRYTIYNVEYQNANQNKDAIIIIPNHEDIAEKSRIKIYPIGFKLFYAENYK